MVFFPECESTEHYKATLPNRHVETPSWVRAEEKRERKRRRKEERERERERQRKREREKRREWEKGLSTFPLVHDWRLWPFTITGTPLQSTMGDRGLLVPPWYVSESPDDIIMNVCSIIWGFSLGGAVYTGCKAVRQTYTASRKRKLFTAYLIMVWAEWLASVIISVISWLFLKGLIQPRYAPHRHAKLSTSSSLLTCLEASGFSSLFVGPPFVR
jgi:hypothetical protein